MSRTLNHILLVDDNVHDNFFHERILKKNGFGNNISVATNGYEALDVLLKNNPSVKPLPDLIFLDINMPGMTGWEVLDKLKAASFDVKHSKIFMLSTSSNPDDQRKAAKHESLLGFITKPLTKDHIESILSTYFE